MHKKQKDAFETCLQSIGVTVLQKFPIIFEEEHAAEHDLLLLENVILAPWAKMAGYITGRARLVDVFSSIQSSAKSQGEKKVDESKKGAIKETLLELEAGKLVVSQVKPQHGLRPRLLKH